MAGSAFKDARVVAKAKAEFVPLLIDVAAKPDWKARHAIESTPTVVYATSDGETIAQTEDVQPADQVLEDMGLALEFLKDPDAATK